MYLNLHNFKAYLVVGWNFCFLHRAVQETALQHGNISLIMSSRAALKPASRYCAISFLNCHLCHAQLDTGVTPGGYSSKQLEISDIQLLLNFANCSPHVRSFSLRKEFVTQELFLTVRSFKCDPGVC